MARRTPVAKRAKAAPRWLTQEEELAWRALAMMMHKLHWALECQLERDAALSFIEYHVLARLSEEPAHTLRMSSLAAVTNASLSRLSHMVKRLEAWGLVRHEPDPVDGRYTNAVLTDQGYAKLVDCAPDHVAAVRRLVIEALNPAELSRLQAMAERVTAQVEASDWNQESG